MGKKAKTADVRTFRAGYTFSLIASGIYCTLLKLLEDFFLALCKPLKRECVIRFSTSFVHDSNPSRSLTNRPKFQIISVMIDVFTPKRFFMIVLSCMALGWFLNFFFVQVSVLWIFGICIWPGLFWRNPYFSLPSTVYTIILCTNNMFTVKYSSTQQGSLFQYNTIYTSTVGLHWVSKSMVSSENAITNRQY